MDFFRDEEDIEHSRQARFIIKVGSRIIHFIQVGFMDGRDLETLFLVSFSSLIAIMSEIHIY